MPNISSGFLKNIYLRNLQVGFFVSLGAILFFVPLVLTWYGCNSPEINPQCYYSALLGVIPYSDAGGYYSGALRYLESGLLCLWNLRRPIHTLLFSSELFLTHGSFWYAMILQAFMCGLSCSLAAYAVGKTLGRIAWAVFLVGGFVLAMSFIPTTLTETTGIALGMLAFVFLWIGYITRQVLTFSFGIFVLTFALHARAGAFLVLPCMIFLAMFDFTKSTSARLRIFIHFCGAMIVATLVVIIAQKVYGNADNQMHANFAFTLLGVVSGGKGWIAAYKLYPVLSSMTEPEQASFLYKESLKVFLHNPLLIFLGFAKGFLGFVKLHLSLLVPLDFLKNSSWIKALIRIAGFCLICLCFYILKRAYTNQYLHRMIKFIMAGFMGIIFSALMLWTDGGIRIFAATYPFWVITLVLVVVAYKNRKHIDSFKPASVYYDGSFFYTKLAAIILLSYYLVLSLILPFFTQPQRIKDPFHVFPEKNVILVRNVAKSPYVVIHPSENDFSNHGLREATRKRYEYLGKYCPEISGDLIRIADKQYPSSSFVIFSAMNLRDYSQFFVLSDPGIIQENSTLLELNGKVEKNFFIVSSYKSALVSRNNKEYK
ncbi:MAG: hypothetical protein ACD_21C00250G0050 [uncultured bacterium]|nr:MAG: hypothetical protein ACD_21C00250G0050 [uncultured bacterium]